mmetsp:Transcript_69567/g.155801  ORF Transcript_69567/g.155801 Transcript_69567/m.155801 type:complete len:297 (-) Transcript_69567:453-1343(-)
MGEQGAVGELLRRQRARFLLDLRRLALGSHHGARRLDGLPSVQPELRPGPLAAAGGSGSRRQRGDEPRHGQLPVLPQLRQRRAASGPLPQGRHALGEQLAQLAEDQRRLLLRARARHAPVGHERGRQRRGRPGRAVGPGLLQGLAREEHAVAGGLLLHPLLQADPVGAPGHWHHAHQQLDHRDPPLRAGSAETDAGDRGLLGARDGALHHPRRVRSARCRGQCLRGRDHAARQQESLCGFELPGRQGRRAEVQGDARPRAGPHQGPRSQRYHPRQLLLRAGQWRGGGAAGDLRACG